MALPERQLMQEQRKFQDHKKRKKGVAYKKDKIKKISICLMVCALTLMGILVVNQYSTYLGINNQLIQAENKLESLQEEQGHLKHEITQLNQLNRIEEIASQKLNMTYPENNRNLIYEY